MTRLDWSSAPRRYEAGVDRGVLYPPQGNGVPWNGLVTVEESHLGGDISTYYFDGIKYLEKQEPRSFQATITAFSAPKEFSQCMGELPVIPGFILTRQPRKQFGFSYRTLIEGGDEYKVHIVYNATATPESRGYSTIDGSASATSFSWKIDAVPPKTSGFRPSAHFTLDTTKTDLFTLRAVEDILYGTATSAPRLPSVEELVDIVGLWEPKLIVPAVEPIEVKTNLVLNPSHETDPSSSGWSVTNATIAADESRSRSGSRSMALTAMASGDVVAARRDTLVEVGKSYVMRTSAGASKPGVTVRLDYAFERADNSRVGSYVVLTQSVVSDTELTDIVGITPPVPAETHHIFFVLAILNPGAGTTIFVDASLLTETPDQGYFDGDTPDDLEYTYEWTGTPHASTSVRKTRSVAYLTPGLGDLTPSRIPGIYRDLPTSRLAETAVGGLYRLE